MTNPSSPQWILDIQGDEKKYYNKSYLDFIALLLLYVCIPLAIASIIEVNIYATIPLTFIIILSFLIILSGRATLNLPNILAANLYSIGSELEFLDTNSQTYIKRNQKYIRNCRSTIRKLDTSIKKEHFVKTMLHSEKNLMM